MQDRYRLPAHDEPLLTDRKLDHGAADRPHPARHILGKKRAGEHPRIRRRRLTQGYPLEAFIEDGRASRARLQHERYAQYFHNRRSQRT